jgi:hypothetical protein
MTKYLNFDTYMDFLSKWDPAKVYSGIDSLLTFRVETHTKG